MNFSDARVEREKIVEYLLASTSVAAAAKARFFGGLGFTPDAWEALAQALRHQATQATVKANSSPWGTKFVATGPIDAPNGRRDKITSVWIDDGTGLRLVTAYSD